LESIFLKYRDKADFYFVYIHEAHPTDGWQLESNVDAGIELSQHGSLDERREVAGACCAHLALTMPVLIDGMDNAVERAFNAWPERLYVISAGGQILYQGGKGPYGFDPVEVSSFLADLSI